MKVTDYLNKSDKTLFSYEIIPPKRGRSIDSIFALIEQLLPYEPPFIDLTSRSAEVYYEELDDGTLRRYTKRKRPGTIGLSAAIKNRYDIETVPHALCRGFTKEETEDALIELNFLGINNILAIQGDELRKPSDKTGKTHNIYASDLVGQIRDMNSGQYLEELSGASPTDFCIGVAGYPEKHLEAPNLESDLKYLKKKVDAGADYIVTQMCFDNNKYFNFVKKCRDIGINVPIIPGLKIITRGTHLRTIPKIFHIDIPEELSDKIESCSSEDKIYQVGVDWAIKQCQELIDSKVPCIHFYIMNTASEVAEVVSTIK